MGEKKNKNIYKISMTIIVTVIITFLLTSMMFYNFYMKTDVGKVKVLSKYIKTSNSTKILEKKIEILKKYLQNKYIGELDEQKMVETALKGYVAGIGDKYTEYLTEEELEELMISINGNFVGIGIYMTQSRNDEILVLLPIEGSPAEKAGLKTGDIINKVNEVECKGKTLDEVSEMVKGNEGTKVKLEIKRGKENFEVDVERKKVEITDIKSEVLKENIGYIKLLSFDEGVTSKVRDEIQKFKNKNIKSLIIDLRDNGGGLVTEAVSLSEIFLPRESIVFKAYDKNGKEEITKTKNLQTENLKIVILVNENSASASELFTAAMKENNKATIIGTKTFGKGVMQEVEPLTIGGALKITIEEFKTPKGNKINDVGIIPDIEVENNEEELIISKDKDNQLQEAIKYLKNK